MHIVQDIRVREREVDTGGIGMEELSKDPRG